MTTEFEEKIHSWFQHANTSPLGMTKALELLEKQVLAVFAEHQQKQNKRIGDLEKEVKAQRAIMKDNVPFLHRLGKLEYERKEQNKKLQQIVETLSEPSKFMTEYGKGRLSLACELLGIPKECQPCPILTKCPCNHEFGHCSWKETFKEAELLGKPQV